MTKSVQRQRMPLNTEKGKYLTWSWGHILGTN